MTLSSIINRKYGVEQPYGKYYGSIERMTQLEPGHYNSIISEISDSEAAISSYRNTHKVAACYRTFSDRTMFMLNFLPDATLCWAGSEMPPYSMAIHHPNREFLMVVPAGWCGVQFCITQEMLDQFELFEAINRRRAKHSDNLLALPPDDVRKIATFANDIMESREKLDAEDEVFVGVMLRDYIMNSLVHLIETAIPQKKVPRIYVKHRYWLVRRAMEFIEENISQPVGLIEIASAVHQQPRVLQQAFHEVMNIGPCQYQQLRRLHWVRKELLSSDTTGMPYKRIARKYGFKQYGRFSQQYRRVFKETCTETSRSTSRA